jgi:hypothetical protein
MNHVTRRDAMKLATATGAITLVGSATKAAAQDHKKPKRNNEPPVHSTSTPTQYGARELFAVLDEAGNIKRGFHAISSRQLELGVYEVIFNRDIRRGAYQVTPGGHGYEGMPPSAVASVIGRATDARGVLVYITDLQGDPLAAGFHLLVICPDGFA